MSPTRTPARSPRSTNRTSSQGRFGRTASAAPNRFRRSKPSKSASHKALSALTGLVAGGKASRGGSSGAKRKGAGRLALVAGAVGLAVKNRGRLTGMMGKGDPHRDEAAPPPPMATPPPMGTPPPTV